MRTVDEGADSFGDAKFDALPARVQEALAELAGAAKEGLLALSISVGLGVLNELIAAAVRRGSEAGAVTLVARRVPVQRPRARAADGWGGEAGDLRFADRDPRTKAVLEQMLAGISPRRFSRTREPVGQDVVDAERSTSKSAVSAVRRPHR